MLIARTRNLVMPLAFAGVLICRMMSPDHAAAADFAATAKAFACSVVSPRFEPQPAHAARFADLASAPGGARLRSLVGEPCPHVSHSRDV